VSVTRRKKTVQNASRHRSELLHIGQLAGDCRPLVSK
jgi:hypothetical protein